MAEYHVQKMLKPTKMPKVTTPANKPRFNDFIKPLRRNDLENVFKVIPIAASGARTLMINVVIVIFPPFCTESLFDFYDTTLSHLSKPQDLTSTW